MSNFKFTATKLSNTKQGILRPDEHGYYELVIGGLNAFNASGAYYPLEGAEALFQSSNVFTRRIANGCLKGELGHPKMLPNMSTEQYIDRVMDIEPTLVCCHFKEVWLDKEYGKNNPSFGNPNLVAIMAKVKPTGPYGHSLKESLENHGENVCFSIRSLTNNFYHKGVLHKTLAAISTFDQVIEGGILAASKFSSPTLEQLSEITMRPKVLDNILSSESTTVSTESAKEFIREAMSISTLPVIKKPVYTTW